MKITKTIQRDINFYKSITIELDPPVKTIEALSKAKHGELTPDEAFAQYDTHGTFDGVKDRAETLTLMRKKAGANLQIKMWAEGVADEPTTMPLIEVVEMIAENGYPDWVLSAIVNQASGLFETRRGFTASFTHSIPAEVVLEKPQSGRPGANK